MQIDEVEAQLIREAAGDFVEFRNLPLRPRLHRIDRLAHAIHDEDELEAVRAGQLLDFTQRITG